MFDLIFITHIPVFYKVNLYNSIAENKKIFVIFIAADTSAKRGGDFINIDCAKFEYTILNDGVFENRNVLKSVVRMLQVLSKLKAYRFVVSGWDLCEFWFSWGIIRKKRLCLALESTIYESDIRGIKGLIKRVFLRKVSQVFASGKLHRDLLNALNYNRSINITKGVGIIRKSDSSFKGEKQIKYKVVYVGRLSEEKNLLKAISVFNKFPEITLDLYGDGPLANLIDAVAGDNINVMGAVLNSEIPSILYGADFLLLPSASETWGLVVEEALYNNVPVLLSSRCGVVEIISDNGFVINYDNFDESLSSILMDYKFFVLNALASKNIGKKFIESKDLEQVNAYL